VKRLAAYGEPVEGTPFGRYRLVSVIGEGGMGKVYKAHDTMMARDVAIKVLPAEMGAEPGYRERFRREARPAAWLTEPHIIPIHDTGEIEGRLILPSTGAVQRTGRICL
jgi:serine/threonine protein kinase